MQTCFEILSLNSDESRYRIPTLELLSCASPPKVLRGYFVVAKRLPQENIGRRHARTARRECVSRVSRSDPPGQRRPILGKSCQTGDTSTRDSQCPNAFLS